MEEVSPSDFHVFMSLDVPGFVATNVPVCTLPRTLKKYQISFNAELSHWIVTLTPRGALRAALIASAVYVAVDEGTIPAAERNFSHHN